MIDFVAKNAFAFIFLCSTYVLDMYGRIAAAPAFVCPAFVGDVNCTDRVQSRMQCVYGSDCVASVPRACATEPWFDCRRAKRLDELSFVYVSNWNDKSKIENLISIEGIRETYQMSMHTLSFFVSLVHLVPL